MKTQSLVGKPELRNHSLEHFKTIYILAKNAAEPPISQTKTSHSCAMGKASFEAYGALGMERRLGTQGGNDLQFLWRLRVELRARPHTNVTSEHFRSTYARDFTHGNIIGGRPAVFAALHTRVWCKRGRKAGVGARNLRCIGAGTVDARKSVQSGARSRRAANSLQHLGFAPRSASESPTRGRLVAPRRR